EGDGQLRAGGGPAGAAWRRRRVGGLGCRSGGRRGPAGGRRRRGPGGGAGWGGGAPVGVGAVRGARERVVGWGGALWAGGGGAGSSDGEKESTSLEPVGRTWTKSPSSVSANATILAEPPAATPTAAGVNHTMGGRPAASSARSSSTSSSDREIT